MIALSNTDALIVKCKCCYIISILKNFGCVHGLQLVLWSLIISLVSDSLGSLEVTEISRYHGMQLLMYPPTILLLDATFLLLLVIMCTIFLGINIATIRHIETCFIVPFIYFAGPSVLFFTAPYYFPAIKHMRLHEYLHRRKTCA